MTIEEKIVNLEKELAELKKEVDSQNSNRNARYRNARYYPEPGAKYYYIDYNGQAEATINDETNFDKLAIDFFNTFDPASHDNLEKYAHDVLRVQNRLMQLHEELCPDYWGSENDANSTELILRGGSVNGKVWTACVRSSSAEGYVKFPHDKALEAVHILNAEKFMINDQNG